MIDINGNYIIMSDSDEVCCKVHQVLTKWGSLNWLQQFVVEEGLDSSADDACLLSPVDLKTSIVALMCQPLAPKC